MQLAYWASAAESPSAGVLDCGVGGAVVVVVGGSVVEVVLVEVVVDEVRFVVVVVARFAAGFPPPCEHAVATKATTPRASITVTPGRSCRPWN